MKVFLRVTGQILFLLCILQPAFAGLSFLTISDIHFGSKSTSKDGQDTGSAFLNISMNKLNSLSQDVNFILYLGDLPVHLLWDVATKERYETILFHALYKADSAKKPMFYVPGNNDSLAGNYQPFESNGISPLNFALDWTGACVHCKGLIIDGSAMRSGGYYSSYVVPANKEIILIVLNTMQWASPPLFSTPYPHQEEDALKQLSWLKQQLKKHHAKQLLIALHIPPGKIYNGKILWKEPYLQAFLALLKQYHHQYKQVTLLSGHIHMDEIRKIYLSDSSTIYDYGTPAISRIHHNNPGMKLFKLNNHLALKNFTTYYTSSYSAWGTEHYQAIGSSQAIFPNCSNKTLSQCLDNLSDKQACAYLDKGLIFEVKSTRVMNKACNTTYRVESTSFPTQ